MKQVCACIVLKRMGARKQNLRRLSGSAILSLVPLAEKSYIQCNQHCVPLWSFDITGITRTIDKMTPRNVSFAPAAQFPTNPAPRAFQDRSNSDADASWVQEAFRAIHQEFLAQTQRHLLNCIAVNLVESDKEERIFQLHVRDDLTIDLSWDGATAIGPVELPSEDGLPDEYMNSDATWPDLSSGGWKGQVLEVDEKERDLYVSLDNAFTPCPGLFYVYPYGFLETLRTVYHPNGCFLGFHSTLAHRLKATLGGLHPPMPPLRQFSLPELKSVWNSVWGILWGPPGTGKTTTIGRQIARCVGDVSERILVVSTTNKATDEIAMKVGQNLGVWREDRKVFRVGRNANQEGFEREGLGKLLPSRNRELHRQIGEARQQLKKARSAEERALLRARIGRLQRELKNLDQAIFQDQNVAVVVATASRALDIMPHFIQTFAEGITPFTSLVIDEAGLVPRATVAALSLYASRRVLLVGDPKQLSPISRMSRILPSEEARWLASSGLSHLTTTRNLPSAVHLLKKQYRMHPTISKVVSMYQYDGLLEDADQVKPSTWTRILGRRDSQQRARWIVLDAHGLSPRAIRATRGPTGRGWIREGTRTILKILFSHEKLRIKSGVYLAPFRAQVQYIRDFLAESSLDGWDASTIHTQQGLEANVVIFDTVNAGSTGWQISEWQRLVNVAMSRAREWLLILASEDEMRQPFLAPLLDYLIPSRITLDGDGFQTERPSTISKNSAKPASLSGLLANPESLGAQIAQRKRLHPILSAEQQRLVNLRLDGKPRLVRGVAGSGKTLVLAHWLVQSIRTSPSPQAPIWVVYGNYSLRPLIEEMIQRGWERAKERGAFPWDRVRIRHIMEVLDDLEHQHPGMNHSQEGKFDYNARADSYLRHYGSPRPVCSAMFIDEAQDMGPETLRLLAHLVQPTDPNNPQSRAIHIFYDNAQNLYGRPTPKWSDLGIDMRGRSTIMKESFRSTRPIMEYALNVLYGLEPPDRDPDHRELERKGLVKKLSMNGYNWWRVHFNQIEGPWPTFSIHQTIQQQLTAVGRKIVHWVQREGVEPRDIRVLYNGIKDDIGSYLLPFLAQNGLTADLYTGRQMNYRYNGVLITTPHSFKGYDAEIIVIVSAEHFVGGDRILSNALYTAMTRARSILDIHACSSIQDERKREKGRRITDALARTDTLSRVFLPFGTPPEQQTASSQ
ncbi:MAG: AAA family ATPase [Nitrospirae bacterium]|nr:MAG: AAA family ATPase [Nitrospirota bacterium]